MNGLFVGFIMAARVVFGANGDHIVSLFFFLAPEVCFVQSFTLVGRANRVVVITDVAPWLIHMKIQGLVRAIRLIPASHLASIPVARQGFRFHGKNAALDFTCVRNFNFYPAGFQPIQPGLGGSLAFKGPENS